MSSGIAGSVAKPNHAFSKGDFVCMTGNTAPCVITHVGGFTTPRGGLLSGFPEYDIYNSSTDKIVTGIAEHMLVALVATRDQARILNAKAAAAEVRETMTGWPPN